MSWYISASGTKDAVRKALGPQIEQSLRSCAAVPSEVSQISLATKLIEHEIESCPVEKVFVQAGGHHWGGSEHQTGNRSVNVAVTAIQDPHPT